MDASDWDERYRRAAATAGGALWASEPPRALRLAASAYPPGTALDLATGDGRTAVWLAQRGWEVTAVDFSAEALSLARRRPCSESVDWQLGDARCWDADAPFDLVVIAYLHIPGIADVLRRAADFVAPGGRLIVIGHDIDTIASGGPGPRDPSVLYTPELLRTALTGRLIVDGSRKIIRDADDHETSRPGPTSARGSDTMLTAHRPLLAGA